MSVSNIPLLSSRASSLLKNLKNDSKIGKILGYTKEASGKIAKSNFSKFTSTISDFVSLDVSISASAFLAWQNGLLNKDVLPYHNAFSGNYQVVGIDATIPIPEVPFIKVGRGINFSTNLSQAYDYYINDVPSQVNNTFWSSITVDASVGIGFPSKADVDITLGGGTVTFIDKNVGEAKSYSETLQRWLDLISLFFSSPKDPIKEDYSIKADKKYKWTKTNYYTLDYLKDKYYRGRDENINKMLQKGTAENYVFTYVQPNGDFIDLPVSYGVSFVGGTFNYNVINNLSDGVLMAFMDDLSEEYFARFSDDGKNFEGYYSIQDPAKKYNGELNSANYMFPYHYYNVMVGIANSDGILHYARILLKPRTNSSAIITENLMTSSKLWTERQDNIETIDSTPIDANQNFYLPPSTDVSGHWEDIVYNEQDPTDEQSILSKVFIRKFVFTTSTKYELYQMKDSKFLLYDGNKFYSNVDYHKDYMWVEVAE